MVEANETTALRAGPVYLADHDILVRPLDTLTAIYQRRAGITHIVVDPVPQILTIMGRQPMRAGDVLVALNAAHNIPPAADDPFAVIAARLAELADIGLIEQVAPATQARRDA